MLDTNTRWRKMLLLTLLEISARHVVLWKKFAYFHLWYEHVFMFHLFLQLLVALVSTYRYGGDEIDISLAKSEARILQDVINQKKLNHEETIRILGTRSKAQLNATFNCYREDYGTPIEEVQS